MCLVINWPADFVVLLLRECFCWIGGFGCLFGLLFGIAFVYVRFSRFMGFTWVWFVCLFWFTLVINLLNW